MEKKETVWEWVTITTETITGEAWEASYILPGQEFEDKKFSGFVFASEDAALAHARADIDREYDVLDQRRKAILAARTKKVPMMRLK